MAPSWNHAAIAANIITTINTKNKGSFRTFSKLSLMINGVEHKPDVCVYPWAKLNTNKDMSKVEKMPLVAIEISSPKQGMGDLFEKASIYLEAGIQSVWVAEPFIQTIAVLSEMETPPRKYIEGKIEDQTGVVLEMGEVFE